MSKPENLELRSEQGGNVSIKDARSLVGKISRLMSKFLMIKRKPELFRSQRS